ncbi:hypothetical protein B0F90DRAFT_1707057 [Multifurca ochricompacta]|uniref:PH domain-containing protein n=1 Tax=Multifurca ochricompacta TaxID=376703 RepID=A0AAD4M7N4_9AGAM|nr:hypothetical protein B0F90DRAFT_1707057 [Multifurca ochricompacta]
MAQPAAPPTPQEVTRKLSIHSAVKPKVIPPPNAAISGTESDSDSGLLPEHTASGSAPPLLSAIVEKRRAGEDSEEDDEEDTGAWRTAADVIPRAAGESDLRAGYLWKKGERRKTWKRRWFVLRSAHFAYYKTSAEYELHRLLDLQDVHACTPVALKRRENTFGVVTATRTYYLQAESQEDAKAWVVAIREAKEAQLVTAAPGSTPSSPPIPIPGRPRIPAITPSPPSRTLHAVTSSESEDAASPNTQRMLGMLPPPPSSPAITSSSPRIGGGGGGGGPVDGSKVVMSGYITKMGKRRNWRKRWFMLNGEMLMYAGSHMDTKVHRQIPLSQILDAFEYDVPPATAPPSHSRGGGGGWEEDDHTLLKHTFKIVTTKRTLVLCAPSEEEEIQWLSAVRALIARRSDAGVVPGDVQVVVQVQQQVQQQQQQQQQQQGTMLAPKSGGGIDHGHGQMVTVSGSGGGIMKNRRETLPRKISLSGSGAGLFAPGTAPIAEESVS